MSRLFSVLIQLSIILSVFLSCSTDRIAGTGTDTSTRDVYASVNGMIVGTDNTPATNCVVYLLPSDFNPVCDSMDSSGSIDTTGSDGQYHLLAPDSGIYNIVFVSQSKSGIHKNMLIHDKKTYIPDPDTLKNSTTLKVSVHEKMISGSGCLFFRGTPFTARVNGSDVVLENLPAGKLSLYYVESVNSHSASLVRDSVSTDSINNINMFNALLVTDNTPDKYSSLIMQQVSSIGGVVETSDAAIFNSSAANFSVVIICPSVPNNMIELLDSTIQSPVIVCKHQFFGKMGLCGPQSGRDFGSVDSAGSIIITDSLHPLTKGFYGIVNVYKNPKTLNWAIPENATILARTADSLSLPVLFCYDKKQPMYASDAPARRVGFFIESNPSVESLTNDGWQLFKNAIIWAISK